MDSVKLGELKRAAHDLLGHVRNQGDVLGPLACRAIERYQYQCDPQTILWLISRAERAEELEKLSPSPP